MLFGLVFVGGGDENDDDGGDDAIHNDADAAALLINIQLNTLLAIV